MTYWIEWRASEVASPILLGVQTDTGPIFVVAEIMPSSSRNSQRRYSRQTVGKSGQSIRVQLADLPVRRSSVARIDGSYVHGRDIGKEYKDLAKMRVAIAGCGSLGGAIARLLAQAGVGRLALIDGDQLAAHNTSRHVLGQFYLGQNKAQALASFLDQDFPHMATTIAFDTRVELLGAERLKELENFDLFISAGIDFLGDLAISRWRAEDIESRPYHVTTWVEPFALVGHAAALFEDRDISAVVDDDGNSRYRMIDWDGTARIEWPEAGCGASFQPHGAVDLQRTVALAARLCLDVLNLKITESTRCVWFGDRNALGPLGGTARADFDQSNVEKTLAWPADAPLRR